MTINWNKFWIISGLVCLKAVTFLMIIFIDGAPLPVRFLFIASDIYIFYTSIVDFNNFFKHCIPFMLFLQGVLYLWGKIMLKFDFYYHRDELPFFLLVLALLVLYPVLSGYVYNFFLNKFPKNKSQKNK